MSLYSTLRYIWHHPVSSKDRVGALGRFARWQIGSRLLGQPVVSPFVEDAVLVVNPGMTGATGNIYCGLHEFTDMGFLLHYLRPEDCFFDLGANVGSYTILASAVVGASSISIEPIPNTHEFLKRNIRANDLSEKVRPMQVACSEEPGRLLMTSDKDCMNQIVDESYQGATLEVPVTTIDTVLNDRAVACWKVDVEGHELSALQGAKNSLKDQSLNAVIMEGHDPEIAKCMTDAGFQLMQYDPFTRKLDLPDANIKTHNHLWIRDRELVARRCQDSESYRVAGISI